MLGLKLDNYMLSSNYSFLSNPPGNVSLILDTFKNVLSSDTFLSEISLGICCVTETFFIEMTDNLQSVIYAACTYAKFSIRTYFIQDISMSA